jgi:hypothetical protein
LPIVAQNRCKIVTLTDVWGGLATPPGAPATLPRRPLYIERIARRDLGQVAPKFDLAHAMDHRGIFIANLSKGPGSRQRRRYADPPTAAFLTGLGAGGRSPLRSRPVRPSFVDGGRNQTHAARHLAPPPCACIKARPFGRYAALTPLVVGARWSVPAPGKSASRASPRKRRWGRLPALCHAIFLGAR